MTTGVYLHAKPGAENLKEVFYVGKGTKERSRSFTGSRNKHYRNVVNKYGIGYRGKKNITVLYIECQSEPIAFALEIELIRTLRELGANLVNATDGGEGGGSGDEHWTKKMPERIKRGSAHKNFGKIRSEESREKNRQAHIGRPVVNKGARGMQRWVTDGEFSKCVRATDVHLYLSKGWVFGRTGYGKIYLIKAA